MDPALLAATQGANQIQAPASNLGASQGPELANLYRSSFQLPQSSGAVSAQANVAQQQVEAAKKAQAEAEARQKDLSDPSKYRKVPGKDGGFDFFAPDGSQVDIATLTQRTGTKANDWIKDSQNPIDRQYLSDSNRLQNYGQAIQDAAKGDKKAIAKVQQFNASDKNLQQLWDQHLKQKSDANSYLQNVASLFKDHYQRYYVTQQQDPNAWGANPGDALFANPQNFSSPPSLPYVQPASGGHGGFKTR